MKRKACFWAIFLLLFPLLCAPAWGDTIVTYGGTFAAEDEGYQAFLDEHPGVSLSWPEEVYFSTAAFTTALLTRDYSCDMFLWGTSQIDWSSLMDKGYCLDLSGSQVLTDAVGRMHPNIAKLAMRDGRLYAVPNFASFVFLQIEKDTWFEAGLTLGDVPGTFPEFLDFLERWCDRIEDDPEPTIRVLGGWEASYTESSYVDWLTRLLIEEAIMQMQYAGEELHFEGPELLALLERCDAVGRRIYSLESPSGYRSLFDMAARGIWPENYAHVVFLRQNGEQPKLIRSFVMMWAICSYTQQPELCLELLESVVSGPGDPYFSSDMFLYRDAQARIHPEYESELARWTGEAAAVAERLKEPKLDEEERTELEEALARYQRAVETTEQGKWLMLPEQLADYQAAADRLYFPLPDLFAETNSDGEIAALYARFANRLLTAEQFMKELNRIAQMMRLEGE